MLKKRYLMLTVAFLVSIVSILVVNGIVLEDNIEVERNTDLTYYLDIEYDGIDVKGIESNDNVRANISSDTIYVEDKIPEGLTFKDFVRTEDGSIGAVSRDDENINCLGKVVDGVDGLHYDHDTRTVSFTVKNLQAGCKLTVGIITTTPETVDDPSTDNTEKRRDFYNTATATEGKYTTESNTVHVWMGEEDIKLYKVNYQYEGVVPPNAPNLPKESSFAPSSIVGVEKNAILEGYTFSGWKMNSDNSDIVIEDGKFTMPDHDVTLVGSFSEKPKHSVSYEISGIKPNSYLLPDTKEYYEDQVVNVDGLKDGDIIDGYIFKGWTTSDVVVTDDNDFIMPNKDVRFEGNFEEITYTVNYKFQGVNIPYNAESLLPSPQKYRPGSTVKTAPNPSVSGYRFLGWYKENEFIMPEHDVVIYGEWMVETGTFEPTITKRIINKKEAYRVGEIVPYEITITNNADYAIKLVTVKENNPNAHFVKDTNYELINDQLIRISEIKPHSSIKVKAEYKVTEKDHGTITNEVEIISALADSNNHLNPDKTYKDTEEFNTYSKINVCKNVSGSKESRTFQFHITSDNYDTWLSINSNNCISIFVPAGTYKIEEILAQEYALKSVTGAISSNKGTFKVEAGETYNITFNNEYISKGFFHSFGRIENVLGA